MCLLDSPTSVVSLLMLQTLPESAGVAEYRNGCSPACLNDECPSVAFSLEFTGLANKHSSHLKGIVLGH